ncbi:helix-turn-helix domain-containing protein [Pseudomonas sp. MWU13-2105]|uniref:helix-turn-helix domain-containing protein n=1 Tax=Pseudomonas sp. MWU13-2105 TaxID=2935074 RepID=UPI00200DC8C3|nr:helix-turn-helix transcriptional regulator [Pseudomonas sp. MWU13-2105]
MSLKTGFAAVLKAMRVSRGLTQKHMADSTSRTYMSKLEQGRSSPTIDKLTAISGALGLSPLTLFTLTLSVESGQTVKTPVQHLEADIADLEAMGALKSLGLSSVSDVRPTRVIPSRLERSTAPYSQAELCFAEQEKA